MISNWRFSASDRVVTGHMASAWSSRPLVSFPAKCITRFDGLARSLIIVPIDAAPQSGVPMLLANVLYPRKQTLRRAALARPSSAFVRHWFHFALIVNTIGIFSRFFSLPTYDQFILHHSICSQVSSITAVIVRAARELSAVWRRYRRTRCSSRRVWSWVGSPVRPNRPQPTKVALLHNDQLGDLVGG